MFRSSAITPASQPIIKRTTLRWGSWVLSLQIVWQSGSKRFSWPASTATAVSLKLENVVPGRFFFLSFSCYCCGHFFLFCFSYIYSSPFGQAVVTGVVPSSPTRFLPSIFIAHRVQQSHCSKIFSSSVANSRARTLQEKVPTNLYEYALGGIRTHETDLYQARG